VGKGIVERIPVQECVQECRVDRSADLAASLLTTRLWDYKVDYFSGGLVKTPLLAQTRVCAIVPVRNEAEHIVSTLTALANQVDFHGKPLDPNCYEVIIFANNCTDNSAGLVRRFISQHPHFLLHLIEQELPSAEAHIGRARQLVMDEAHRRFMVLNQQQGIIASTDGDSQVDSKWVASILHEIDRGADAVGGRIITDRAGRSALDQCTRASYLRSVGYHHLVTQLENYIDPDPFDHWPSHHQFFGANFAVTHEMYALAGGMPSVRTPEDVAFHRALMRAGAQLRYSSRMRVITSARQTGRTSIGLANQLAQWQTMGHQQQTDWVESAEAIEAKLRARRELRTVWEQFTENHGLSKQTLKQLAMKLAVSVDRLIYAVEHSSSFGAFYQQIEQHQQDAGLWRQRWSAVGIEVAIAQLRLRIHQLRQQSAPATSE
jgi:hypothetical protein